MKIAYRRVSNVNLLTSKKLITPLYVKLINERVTNFIQNIEKQKNVTMQDLLQPLKNPRIFAQDSFQVAIHGHIPTPLLNPLQPQREIHVQILKFESIEPNIQCDLLLPMFSRPSFAT